MLEHLIEDEVTIVCWLESSQAWWLVAQMLEHLIASKVTIVCWYQVQPSRVHSHKGLNPPIYNKLVAQRLEYLLDR